MFQILSGETLAASATDDDLKIFEPNLSFVRVAKIFLNTYTLLALKSYKDTIPRGKVAGKVKFKIGAANVRA